MITHKHLPPWIHESKSAISYKENALLTIKIYKIYVMCDHDFRHNPPIISSFDLFSDNNMVPQKKPDYRAISACSAASSSSSAVLLCATGRTGCLPAGTAGTVAAGAVVAG